MDITQLFANYSASAQVKLQTNSTLTSAEAAYALAVTNLMVAIQGGNQQAINAASAALLAANSAQTSAQVADANASAALIGATNALFAAMVARLSGG